MGDINFMSLFWAGLILGALVVIPLVLLVQWLFHHVSIGWM